MLALHDPPVRGPWATDHRTMAGLGGVHYSHDAHICSLRFSGGSSADFEMGEQFGLTFQTGATARLTRRNGAARHADASAIGRVFLDRPGDLARFRFEGETRTIAFKLPGTRLADILLEDHDEPRGCDALRTINGEFDFQLLALAGRALLVGGVSYEIAVRALVAALLARHRDGGSGTSTRGLPAWRLKRVRDLVATDPAGVTLAAMAAEAGLSLYHFAREFRRETGQTPWTFVIHWRLWEATRLLAARDRTVDEVARMLGFTDASHMGRSFRGQIGVSVGGARGRLLP